MWLDTVLCILAMYACDFAIKIEKAGRSVEQACDINDLISYSSVLISKYAHMVKLVLNLDDSHLLNLSNAQYGLFAYFVLMIVQFFEYNELFLMMTTASVIASLVLAYILRFILHQFCSVCAFMYGVNFLLFVSSVFRIIS
jgi:uncharacterized membrane protein